jgi:hypothetical protein
MMLSCNRFDSADELIDVNEILVVWSALQAFFENRLVLKDNHRHTESAA